MKFLKKQMILIAVIAVIGVAIFLNWRINDTPNADEVMSQQHSQSQNSDQSSILGQADFVSSNVEYFDAARLNRQETRQQALDIANHLLTNEEATQEEREQASAQIVSLSNAADAEGRIENLIMAKGYSECVAFVGEDSINVVVKSDGLTSSEVIAIKDIAVSQTEMDASSVKIIESK